MCEWKGIEGSKRNEGEVEEERNGAKGKWKKWGGKKWSKGGVKEMKGVKEEQNETKKERKKRINEG